MVGFRRVEPTNKPTSQRRKGLVSEGVHVYSPGRSKKKNAKVIMSATAIAEGSLASVAVWTML